MEKIEEIISFIGDFSEPYTHLVNQFIHSKLFKIIAKLFISIITLAKLLYYLHKNKSFEKKKYSIKKFN